MPRRPRHGPGEGEGHAPHDDDGGHGVTDGDGRLDAVGLARVDPRAEDDHAEAELDNEGHDQCEGQPARAGATDPLGQSDDRAGGDDGHRHAQALQRRGPVDLDHGPQRPAKAARERPCPRGGGAGDDAPQQVHDHQQRERAAREAAGGHGVGEHLAPAQRQVGGGGQQECDEREAEVEQPEQQRQGEQDDHHPEDGGADGATERDPRQDADPAVGVSAAKPAGQPGQDETGEGDRAVHELDDRVLEPADLQLRGDLIGIARRPRRAGGTRVGGAHHRAEQDRDEDQAHGPGTELGQSGVVH